MKSKELLFKEVQRIKETLTDDIQFTPRADHGEWLIYGGGREEDGRVVIIFKCSVCGRLQGCITNYCADCGAEMGIEGVED